MPPGFTRAARSAATLEMLFSFESRLSGDPDRETKVPLASDSRSVSDQKPASESADGSVSGALPFCAAAGDPASNAAAAASATTVTTPRDDLIRLI